MKKKEIQQMVLQNGKPLDLDKFEWDENTNTFSSEENNLFLDFKNIAFCTIRAARGCTINTDSSCFIRTGGCCTINTRYDCYIKTGSYCTIRTGANCTIITGANCTINTFSSCNIDTNINCTINTTFSSIINADSSCDVKTGNSCFIKTGDYCNIKTGNYCIFNHCFGCTINAGSNCVIITKPTRELQIITPKKRVKLQLPPYRVKGYIENGIYSKTGKPAIICDNILNEYTNKKEINGLEIFKIKNGYVVKEGELSAHGETIKQCIEDLKFKISNRDTSKYKDCTLDTIVSQEEAIKMYRTITGACEFGTKKFCSNIKLKKEYSIKEIIDITKGQYGNETFKNFFKLNEKENVFD